MKSDRIYLVHIREAIGWIYEYTAEGKDAFFKDRKTQDAVIRNLEIVGEAVKKLGMQIRDDNADIPWKQIAGMRDHLIHEYFGVDLNLVYGVVENHLQPLKDRVDALIEALEE